MTLDYDDIIRTAKAHLERSEEDTDEYCRAVLDLEPGALQTAAAYEVAHTLGFSLGLLTPEEKEDPQTFNDPQALMETLIQRLSDVPMPAVDVVALLTTEFDFGIRVGMELQRERTPDAQA